ncbi:MAG TPA: orotate phosphoribosyltransferase [Pseudobdellovibrionaceae bacterium]|nr:orotate phosphoribosyltransferase [Pseudobdellovibrionaceae bacterium]
MTRFELARKIHELSYLKGNFKLRSGQTSTEYFDKYRFESQPLVLQEIAKHLAPMIPQGTELLAGLEMGGIPVATALSLATGIPCVFVRKTAKEYGTCQFAEGADISEKKLLVIEDVITTGGQVLESTQALRNSGALISSVLCVIYRGPENENPLAAGNLNLQALFSKKELLAN